jgi:5'-3' exonuclease
MTKLLIDGNLVARREFEGGAKVPVVFPEYVLELKDRFASEGEWVAWDSDTSWRKKESATYKKRRGERAWPERDAYYAQLRDLRPMLSGMGVKQVVARDYESDDCLATLAKREAGDVVIVSNDHDLWVTMCDSRVWMLCPGEDLPFDGGGLFAREGLHPSEAHAVACLRGCPSDEIGGLKGVGLDWAIRIVRACPNIVTWLKDGRDTDIRTAVMKNCNRAINKAEQAIRERKIVFETEKLVRLYDDLTLETIQS